MSDAHDALGKLPMDDLWAVGVGVFKKLPAIQNGLADDPAQALRDLLELAATTEERILSIAEDQRLSPSDPGDIF